jgi:hypothetical protein
MDWGLTGRFILETIPSIMITILLFLLVVASLLVLVFSPRGQRFLGFAHDWKLVGSQRIKYEEWTILYGHETPKIPRTKTLILERCAITGRERARMVYSPESHFETCNVDVAAAKAQLGLVDSAGAEIPVK